MRKSFAELRTYAQQADIPILSQNTESFLKHYIKDNNIQHIIEIGSAIGYSTGCCITSIDQKINDKGSITSWEISYPHYYQALQNTHSYHGTTLLLGNFCSYPLEKYLQPGQYDMVFIDGRKSETLEYLRLLTPYLKTTTHIIIDDAIKFKSKMKDCYDFLDMYNIDYKIEQLDNDDGILLIQESEHLLKALSSL